MSAHAFQYAEQKKKNHHQSSKFLTPWQIVTKHLPFFFSPPGFKDTALTHRLYQHEQLQNDLGKTAELTMSKIIILYQVDHGSTQRPHSGLTVPLCWIL